MFREHWQTIKKKTVMDVTIIDTCMLCEENRQYIVRDDYIRYIIDLRMRRSDQLLVFGECLEKDITSDVQACFQCQVVLHKNFKRNNDL